ncbi:MAG: tetratricopeptide repeat protein [Alphaproteobacteria bacterium]|nr:tetratricopeptide repeat protein [Alphaproteobacteria bacterium]
MGGGGSKASGGGSKGVSRGDVCRVDKRHDSSRPCPSGGEGRYSAHDVCYKGRVYSDKGRADGCYDRTDKFCTTGSSYPSAHSTSRGGEGRGGTSGSSGTHRESRSSENTSYTSKQHIDKSVDFRKSKDYESALKSCDAALQADPKYLDGWNENAAIYIDKAEYKKAIESCDKAIKIDQKYFYAYNNKAVVSNGSKMIQSTG